MKRRVRKLVDIHVGKHTCRIEIKMRRLLFEISGSLRSVLYEGCKDKEVEKEKRNRG